MSGRWVVAQERRRTEQEGRTKAEPSCLGRGHREHVNPPEGGASLGTRVFTRLRVGGRGSQHREEPQQGVGRTSEATGDLRLGPAPPPRHPCLPPELPRSLVDLPSGVRLTQHSALPRPPTPTHLYLPLNASPPSLVSWRARGAFPARLLLCPRAAGGSRGVSKLQK